ncbi:hybrid sensor histidine kinase/response regulator [Piscinibacter defluvii]|uniref:hybrid sensor histidine kinase/response regulator n=1 Tax=Piscinibacter defluvii TaxID=1796922 RepID=UPI000FDE19CE
MPSDQTSPVAALPVGPGLTPPPGTKPVQRVVKVRRDYNSWVARETMEDYALRFTPRSFRKWSSMRVANTAFGAASFLVLEAVGGTLLVDYGFVNAFWAILATGLIIFAAGWPISVYAARHGVDMDLLTRGAGFGYLGSTITSLIYASFTFIFFALEAAIMAYAIELAFDIPPAWGYLICALVVIPLVTHGVTTISRLQVWTQPLWLAMLIVPFFYIFAQHPGVLGELWQFGGIAPGGAPDERMPAGFDLLKFGAAMTVGIALITQMGEQADYLRFMPEATPGRKASWWAGVVIGGPGWVIPGVLKMLAGALLAFLALGYAVPPDRAVDPTQMYLIAYGAMTGKFGLAVAATAIFVIVSQLKINVTNAYAGSLAWSNFFARLTHSHPGRVVWMVFNTLIALMLMELNVFQALGKVLGLYSNIAISWMMAVVADLVINKPMGWSPRGIEFKRAHLYDVNPVGVGAMGIASVVSIAAYLGAMGELAQAFSAVIAMVTAFVASPVIAWATKGRYYLARQPEKNEEPGTYKRLTRCTICERDYERDDMAHCPAYGGAICSLCCSLDARCHDLCKPEARLSVQWRRALSRVVPEPLWARLDTELGHYLMLMALAVPALAGLFVAVWRHERRLLGALSPAAESALQLGYLKIFAALLVLTAVVLWWLVLKHRSALVAQEESNRQTLLLVQEIESHRRTDAALQLAKQAADSANQAKSRYISAISHELRTPLNSILGYAQLLDDDPAIPEARRQAVRVIKRGGDHLLSLIEGTLDIARIEGGKLRLEPGAMRLREALQEIARMFELQARSKGIDFVAEIDPQAPGVVRADEKRLRQILINLLGNAVKFTARGQVRFRLRYAREIAQFEVEDTGPGIAPDELARVFEPFARGASAGQGGGTGLGLTIAKMLTELMGGELTVDSRPGHGSTFRVRLFLPELRADALPARVAQARTGYAGPRRRILVVDNEEADRGLLVNLLQPLGFEVRTAESGEDCLARLRAWREGAGPWPDAIFMDLAMPGIDGWETLRRIRREALGPAALAIVSANAFDKGLENDVGIGAADFITKPVRVDELLDWLGRALALDWTASAPAAPEPLPEAPLSLPAEPQLRALQELVNLGYVRGIVRQLDQIQAESPDSAAFVERMRTLARGFRLDEMNGELSRALSD